MRKIIAKYGWFRIWIAVIAVALLVTGSTIWGIRSWYYHNLSPVSQSEQINYFTVESGDSLNAIANKLANEGLIRSSRAFETYVRGRGLYDQLQAGTYALSPSMSAGEIVDKLIEGDVAKNLLTILPGKRLDEIKQTFIDEGYSKAEVEKAFDPGNYVNHPALAGKPADASLEGYIYPESFQKLANTPAQTIVLQSLDEMAKNLTPDILDGFEAQDLTPHQGVIMASIVLREYSNPADETYVMPKIAQVFLSRLKQNMALEADPTAIYGAVNDGISLPAGEGRARAAIGHDSPYNTYLYPGLPPGPISNTNANALRAVAAPDSSTYLYFVAGDDCVVRFSHSLEEHQELADKYLKNGCVH
jgi:UPF0755 protein